MDDSLYLRQLEGTVFRILRSCRSVFHWLTFTVRKAIFVQGTQLYVGSTALYYISDISVKNQHSLLRCCEKTDGNVGYLRKGNSLDSLMAPWRRRKRGDNGGVMGTRDRDTG